MVKQREDDNRTAIAINIRCLFAISICDKFGAERSHQKEGTVLTFDPEKLVRIGNLYNLETNIQTKIAVGEGGDSGEGSRQYTPPYVNPGMRVKAVTAVKALGGIPLYYLKRIMTVKAMKAMKALQGTPHISKHINNEESRSTVAAIPENSIHTNTNTNDLVDCFWKDNHPQYPIEPSQPSQPSPQDNTVVAGSR